NRRLGKAPVREEDESSRRLLLKDVREQPLHGCRLGETHLGEHEDHEVNKVRLQLPVDLIRMMDTVAHSLNLIGSLTGTSMPSSIASYSSASRKAASAASLTVGMPTLNSFAISTAVFRSDDSAI